MGRTHASKAGQNIASRRRLALRAKAGWLPALAIRDGNKVSLVSRNRNDLTDRFPAVVEGLRQLKSKQQSHERTSQCVRAFAPSRQSILRIAHRSASLRLLLSLFSRRAPD